MPVTVDDTAADPIVGHAAEAFESEVQPASVDTVAAELLLNSGATNQAGPLQRDLQISRQWIDQADRNLGTVQFMLLSVQGFDEAAYYEYVDRLEAGGVDRSLIRIFRTLTVGPGSLQRHLR